LISYLFHFWQEVKDGQTPFKWIFANGYLDISLPGIHEEQRRGCSA